MQELTNKEMKEIQLKILDYVHSICQQHGLTYFLMFGTLLGAVRHKGFIPWDDDIDICMPATDYAKFINLMKTDDNYNVICPDTDPDYYFYFARISDKRTTLQFKMIREIHNLGVFIDVFPINEGPSNDRILEWKNKYHELQHKVLLTVPDSAAYQDYSIRCYARRMRLLPQRRIFGKNNFFKYRSEWLQLITQYNGTNAFYCSCGENFRILTFSSFRDYTELEFEGKMYKVPKDYDKVLTELYGTYYLLPPKNKRISFHHFSALWKCEGE